MRSSERLRVRGEKKKRERRDYLQFTHQNSATLSEKANALIFYQPEEEGCAVVRLKGIGQQRSQSCGDVNDGVKDERIGFYRRMQMKYCVLVDRCDCLWCRSAVTLFMGSRALAD